MSCIPTLFQHMSEEPKPTLQRLLVLSILAPSPSLSLAPSLSLTFSSSLPLPHFLSLAPSLSISLIHSTPSPSCSLSHVLFESLSLSLTEFQSLPSSPLANLWHVPRSLYLHRLVHRLYRLLQVPAAPGRVARANDGSGRARWLPPGWTHLAFRGIYPPGASLAYPSPRIPP